MRVGELHALLTADNSGFNKAVDDSGRKWQGFTRGVETGGGKVSKAIQGAARTVSSVVAAGATTLTGLTGALAVTGTGYNSLQQNALVALTTMLGSTEKAQAQLEAFNAFASTSPFGRDTFLKAQQTLLGFGMEAENVIPTLDSVQNAVAGIGGTNEDITQIVDALAQIESQGKITGVELQRLGNYGIDAAQLIADATGETREQVKKNISASKYDAETTMDAITSGLMKKFGGAADGIKEQWTGATDRIKAAWRDMGGDLMAPFIDPNGGGYAVVWANDVADLMRALQAKILPLWDQILDRWGGNLEHIGVEIQTLAAKIREFDVSGVGDGLDALIGQAKEFAPLLGMLAGGFGGLMTTAGPLGGLFGALGFSISPLAGAMIGLLASTEENRDAMRRLGEALLPLIAIGGEVTTVMAGFVSDALARLAPSLIDLAGAVAQAATPLAGALVPAAEVAAAVLGPFADMVATVADVLASMPGPLLLAATAFGTFKMGVGPMPAIVSGLTTAMGAVPAVMDKARQAVTVLGNAMHPTGASMKSLGINAQVPAQNFIGLSSNAGKAATSVTTLGGAAKKAGTALKAAFMSNAAGLAITAIVTALSALSAQSAKTEEHINTLADSMDGLESGAEDAKRALYDILADDDLPQRFEDAGLGADNLMEALIEGGDAAADFRQQIDDLRMEELADGNYAAARELKNLGDAFDKQNDKMGEARAENELYKKAMGDVADATEDAADATEDAADAAYHAADANRDHIVTIQELNDLQRARTNATADAKKATLDYAAELEKAAAASDGLASVSADEEYALLSLHKQILSNIDAQDAAGASTSELQGLMAGSREDFIAAAESYGYTAEQAAAYADELGLIPDRVTSTMELETDGALSDLSSFVAEIDLTKGTIVIDGNSYPAEATLEQLGLEVDATTGMVTIDGEEFPAQMKLGELVSQISDATGTVTINGQSYSAQDVLGQLLVGVDASTGTITIDGNKVPADAARRAIENEVNDTTGTMRVNAKTRAAHNDVDKLRTVTGRPINTKVNAATGQAERDINHAARNRSSTITVKGIVTGSGMAAMRALHANNGLIRKGGHTFMADGDVRSRQAMMAPAGSWITWAEDETGGETYIPHAPSKRRRSLNLLAETARMFGYMVIPQSQPMANGGRSGAGTSPAVAGTSMPSTVTVRIGEREFTGYVEDIADDRISVNPGVRAANDFTTNFDRHRKAMR